MPPGDVIIIGPGPKVTSNASTEDTINRLRQVLSDLEDGALAVEPPEEETE